MMVLLGDIVGDDEIAVMRAASEVVRLCNLRRRGLHRRLSERAQEVLARPRPYRRHRQAHQRLQDQRGRGDPAARMGDYCDGIERINIDLSIRNKLRLVDALKAFLDGELPLHPHDANLDAETLIGDRRARALELLSATRARWQWVLDALDLPLAQAEAEFARLGIQAGPLANRADQPTLFHRVQDYSLRISWKTELKPDLEAIFAGVLYRPVLSA